MTENKDPWSCRAYVFALDPTDNQKNILSNWCGATKSMYNDLLHVYETDYGKRLDEACEVFSKENNLSFEEVRKLYKDPDARKSLKKKGFILPKASSNLYKIQYGYKILKELEEAGRSFYKDPPGGSSNSGLQVADSVCLAWRLFFNPPKGMKVGRPKRKNRYSRFSCRFQVQDPDRKKLGNNFIIFPKLGKVKCFENPQERVKGTIQFFTVYRDVDKWYVSISVSDAPKPEQPIKTKETLGIDLNTGRKALALSNGEIIPLPIKIAKLEKRIKRAQRKINRRQKGSNNRKKAVKELSLLQKSLRQFRSDWQHKNTFKISTQYKAIAIEDIKWRNLTASSKGTKEEPGKNVKQKAGLNRSMLRVGLYEIRRQLTYKCSWYESDLVIIDPKNTTQTCSNCGSLKKDEEKLNLSNRVYNCNNCGVSIDRDINSAKNIEQKAFRKSLTCAA